MIKIFAGITVFLLFVGLVPASAQAIKDDGGTLNIHLLDYCDPASFNAVLGEGTCKRDITPGFITFNGFIADRRDLECARAKHGITAFPRWSGGDTQRLDDHLRKHYDTSVVPGRWFEICEYFRVGFGLPTSDFEEALKRLEAALDDLL